MPDILFIVGPPASGKTTLARALASTLGLDYCNPADWLRILRDRQSDLGAYVTSNYTSACLDPIVSQWVGLRIQEAVLLGNMLVVDGYPRTQKQFSSLSTVCANQRFYVISLEHVSQQESVRRTMQRPWEPPHGSIEVGEVYNHHVLTEQEAARRYRNYQSTAPLLDDSMTLHIDASRGPQLVQSQAKHWIDEQPATLLAVQQSKDAAGLYEASPMEAGQVIARTLALANHAPRRRFIGSHPVSLQVSHNTAVLALTHEQTTQRQHLASLTSQAYVVSRKWDGDRALLLIMDGRVWLLFRNFAVLRSGWLSDLVDEQTLIDVEWLPKIDSVVVLDALVIGGVNVMGQPLSVRIDRSRGLLSLIKLACGLKGSVRVQDYFAFSDLRHLSLLPAPAIKTDGYVFTSDSNAYRIGRDSQMYKWKALEENTVDLAVYGQSRLFVRANDEDERLIEVGVLVDNTTPWPDGAILECLPVNTSFKTWRAIKQRVDRCEPNAEWVVGRILESVAENITLEELCDLEGVR